MKISAGVVPVRFKDGEWQYLLLRVFRYWDFPKGLVEASDRGDLKEVALRELLEETSIAEIKRWVTDEFYETEVYQRDKVARYFLAEVSDQTKVHLPISLELGKPEHHEFRWVNYCDAKKLVGERVGKALQWAHQHIE